MADTYEPRRRTGFLWWTDRWRASSAFSDLTLAEQGAYRNLLDAAFLRGGALPDDARILARAAGCDSPAEFKPIWATVRRWFYKTDAGWRNKTLDRVLHAAIRNATKQHAYRARKGNGG